MSARSCKLCFPRRAFTICRILWANLSFRGGLPPFRRRHPVVVLSYGMFEGRTADLGLFISEALSLRGITIGTGASSQLDDVRHDAARQSWRCILTGHLALWRLADGSSPALTMSL
jgi:hypothetical protein